MNELTLTLTIYYPATETIQAAGYWFSIWAISGLVGYQALIVSNLMLIPYKYITYKRPMRTVLCASAFGPAMFVFLIINKSNAEYLHKREELLDEDI